MQLSRSDYIAKNPKFTGCYISSQRVHYHYIDGKLHREDGPAIKGILRKEWWLEGNCYATGPMDDLKWWEQAVREYKLRKFLNE